MCLLSTGSGVRIPPGRPINESYNMNIEAVAKLEKRNIFIGKKSCIPSYTFMRGTQHIKSVPMTGGVAAAHTPMQYTGNNMLGIATMHKSNAVPIFCKESAEDVANMRR